MDEFKKELVSLIPSLLIYARSLTRDLHKAEDLMQETLTKALERKEQFDGTNLKAWVKAILRNTFIDSTRKIKEQRLDVEMEIEIKGEQESTLLERDIDRCLGKLQELPREIVSLLGRGFSYKEIGEMTGTTRENVRVILCRARKQLHDCLEGEKT